MSGARVWTDLDGRPQVDLGRYHRDLCSGRVPTRIISADERERRREAHERAQKLQGMARTRRPFEAGYRDGYAAGWRDHERGSVTQPHIDDTPYRQGFRWGYGNGAVDQGHGEERDDDPGDSWDLWVLENGCEAPETEEAGREPGGYDNGR